ncbi:HNH endonuclease [Cellulosimicrobium cellulans]|uniref:HNH endonuclease n=1 Tax=Cellulosimicrobium cellulans TaxID=1710 RepID=UPI0036F0D48A
MARLYGQEFPERPLMAALSDLLGIPHFTTARGSTVRRDFLEAVCVALGIPEATVTGLPTKDDVIVAMVEAATRRPMDAALLSVGGTVTNGALQAVVDGVTVYGVPGRDVPHEDPTPPLDDLLGAIEFDPSDLKDERDRRLVRQAIREGQDRFRTALVEAYSGKCAITGFDATETLEAAHIYPYTGPATNKVSNGLLLRADIHKLFDRGAIAVHETTFEVLVKPHLMVTSYANLGGGSCVLRLPHKRIHHPSTAALRSHREWAGL